MKHIALLSALLLCFATYQLTLAQNQEWKPEDGFQSIYNGKDFTGWVLTELDKNDPLDGKTETVGKRFIADGEVISANSAQRGESPRNQIINTVRKFPTDLILKVEFRVTGQGADGGVMVRGRRFPLRNFPTGPNAYPRGYKPGDWNFLVITITSNVAQSECNGEVLQAASPVVSDGPIGLAANRGPIEYRRMQVKEIKP